MKKNLFFVALILLLVGAGCEDVSKLGDSNSGKKDVSKVENLNNVENMEVEDSTKEENSKVETETTSPDVQVVKTDKKSPEKMEREDDEDERENESEEDDDKVAPVSNTTPTKTSPTTTNTTTSVKSYTMTEVKAANSEQKCWTAVSGKVYDLTPALNQHPGGKAAIMLLCGTDGTATFNNQHGGQTNPMNMLNGLQIGILK